jgi:hypothetical protein
MLLLPVYIHFLYDFVLTIVFTAAAFLEVGGADNTITVVQNK